MQYQNPFLDESVNEELLLQDSPLSDENQSRFDEQKSNNQWSEPLDWSVVTDLSNQQEGQQSIQESSQHTLKANEEGVKKEDLEAIAKHKMDSDWLFWMIKEWVETAMVQGPKWELLPDRKARASLINAFMKSTWRFKADNVINVLNLFGKVNTEKENDIY